MNKIKAVIFDVDGTLVDRRIAFRRLCEYIVDKYEPTYPYGGTREELIGKMIEIDANGYGGITNFIPRLNQFWKLPISTEDYIRDRNGMFGKLSEPVPQLNEVLSVLKKKYKLGIITNGFSSVQREKIATVGITDYFDDIIVSGEEEFAKPDPRIFEKACARLGVRPEEAVYVGDYYPNDIAGALGAKIKPIWICEVPDGQADYQGIRITDLTELLDIL